ncbi:MAG: magnesium/cobalt transporter CorA [Bacteroidales bacterium]
MARFLKAKKESIGLAPDAIHFRGEVKCTETKIRLIDYNPNEITEKEVGSIDEVLECGKSSTVSWLNIDGLHDEEIMNDLSVGFDIDPLIISDLLNTHIRPKVHEYDNCIFVSLKMLRINDESQKLESENFAIIMKKNILISFQEKEGDLFDPVRERLRKNRKRIRGSGTDYLMFALLDVIIDNYIYIISQLGEKIEDIDDVLIESDSSSRLEDINRYKSELVYLRKIIKPCRELVLNLGKTDSDLINDYMEIHLKELQNNIELANETIDNYREILSDQLNIFHTNMSSRLNAILKILTIFSVIFIPITFIVGVYGTNFDNIPELHLEYGYYMMLTVIIAVVALMIYYFKRKNWF